MTRRRGRILELALDAPPPSVPLASPGEVVYVVLRRGGRPVGRLLVDDGDGPVGAGWLERVAAASADGIAAAEVEADIEPSPLGAADVSVVIATRNRPEDLSTCLAALRALAPPPGEIVVADSASDDPAATARVAEESGARLVRCDRAGLSLARNTGAAAARGSVIAFLDDDCRADAGWLTAIVRGFADPAVDVVTGSYAPSELETEAQLLFLDYAHMDRRGAVPRRFARGSVISRHWPLDVWRVGSGGNIAVRAEAFRAAGGFRLDLGLGTPALGGEDLFLLWSTIRSGREVVYRADAMAWHRHHRGLPALRRVMFGYGAGHAAYLRAAVRDGAPRGQALIYRASFWYDRAKRLARALVSLRPLHAGLVLREAAGMVVGGRAQA